MCFTKAFLITIKHQYHCELEKEKSYISQKEKLNEELIFQQSDSVKGKTETQVFQSLNYGFLLYTTSFASPG